MITPPPAFPSLAAMPVIDVLRLIRTLNVGSVTFFQLIERFGTAAKALQALPELSIRGGRKKPLHACSLQQAQTELEKVEAFGARMVTYRSEGYPVWLTTINDPPPIITIVGHSNLWRNPPLVAIVGARNASANGCAFAKRLATELGEQGACVVSGLARGIDTFAHNGALKTGTVGVVAGGIDHIYPPENKELFAKMKEVGAIISEQAFGMAPFSTSFPSRNRIIAGMTQGTVVIEAALKSGSLITARNALDYHRDVFAVPGSPMDPRAKGCNKLLKDGAIMVESAQDVLRELNVGGGLLSDVPSNDYKAPPAPPVSEEEVAAIRGQVIEKLGASAVGVDELIRQCNVPSGALLTALLELELAGRLQRLPGGRVALLVDEEDNQALELDFG